MRLEPCPSADYFQQQAMPWLLQKEAEYNVIIGLTSALLSKPEMYPEYYLWIVRQDEKVFGVAWWISRQTLGLTAMPEAAVNLLVGAVEDLMRRSGQALLACTGHNTASDLFARLWSEKTGIPVVQTMRQRIYQLQTVTPTQRAPGSLYQATWDDLDLLMRWSLQFVVDAGLSASAEAVRQSVHKAVTAGARYFWQDAAGTFVAMVGYSGETPHGQRVGSVFTPKELVAGFCHRCRERRAVLAGILAVAVGSAA